MNKLTLILIVLLGLGAVCFSIQKKTKPVHPMSQMPLLLEIKSDQSKTKSSEDMAIIASFKNNSDKEIILFWNNGKPSLVSDKSNEITITSSQDEESKIETCYIKPKTVLEKQIKVSLNQLSAASYQITFKYEPPAVNLDFKTTAQQEIWQKTLISNSIALQIEP